MCDPLTVGAITEASAPIVTDIGIGASAAGAAGTAAAGIGATNAALAEAAVAGGATGTALGGATLGTAAAGAGVGATLGKIASSPFGTAVTTQVVSSLLNPRPNVATPTVTPATPMPDPLAQQQALRRSMIDQMARRGRASTIMTDPAPSGGTLGG